MEDAEWTPSTLRETRSSLLEELARLPQIGDVVDWQLRLAMEIMNSERMTDVTGEIRAHRHLLRIIGNVLAETLIEGHTLRALSKHPGPPASLSGQQHGFDHLVSTARKFQTHGFVPILADLTTHVGIGDLICWNTKQLVVVECKDSLMPSSLASAGRLFRQRRRGETLQTYLTESLVEESAETMRVAVPITLEQPDWPRIRKLLVEAWEGPSGYAVLDLGEHDHILAFDSRRIPPEDWFEKLAEPQSMVSPIAFSLTRMIQYPAAGFMGPVSYPVDAGVRAALLEQELILIRLVDMSLLAADFDANDTRINMRLMEGDEGDELVVVAEGMEQFRFTSRMVERLLAQPVALSRSLDPLIAVVAQMLSQVEVEGDAITYKAEGDQVDYLTVFRDGIMSTTGEEVTMIRFNDE